MTKHVSRPPPARSSLSLLQALRNNASILLFSHQLLSCDSLPLLKVAVGRGTRISSRLGGRAGPEHNVLLLQGSKPLLVVQRQRPPTWAQSRFRATQSSRTLSRKQSLKACPAPTHLHPDPAEEERQTPNS